MRKVLLFLSITLLTITAYSQTPVDTADLRAKINSWLVPNSNREITATKINQLFNGMANLMKAYAVDSAYRINDTLFLVRRNGFATIKVTLDKVANFANSDLVFDADHTHDGNHKGVYLDNFGYIELKANTVDGFIRSKISLDTSEGITIEAPNINVRPDIDGNISMSAQADDNRSSSLGVYGGAVSFMSYNNGEMSSSGGSLNPLAATFESHSPYVVDSSFHNRFKISHDGVQQYVSLMNMDNGFGQSIEYRRNERYAAKDSTLSFIQWKHKVTDALIKRTDFNQGLSSFTFDASGSANPNLLFYLKKLPQSTSSSDSVLVRDNNGQVFTRAQAALSPVASVGNYLTMNGSQLRLGGTSIGSNTIMNVDQQTFSYTMAGGRVAMSQSGGNDALDVTVSSSGGGIGLAVVTSSTSNPGINVNSSFGNGVAINLRGGTRPALTIANDSVGIAYTSLSKSTGNIIDGLVLTRAWSSGTQSIPGTGIGIRFDGYYGPFGQGLTDTIADIHAYYTDTTTGTRTGNFAFKIVHNNNLDSQLVIKGSGQLLAPKYTGTNFATIDTSYPAAVFGPDGNIYARRGAGPGAFTQSATVTVSGTTTETTLVGSGLGSLTIPSTKWVAGKTYRIHAAGVLSTDAGNPSQHAFKVKIGSTTIATTANLFNGSGTSNRAFDFDVYFTCRTTGSGGTIMAMGLMRDDNAEINRIDNGNGVTSTVDMTTNQTVNVVVQMTNNSGGNSASVYVLTFEEVN